MAVWFARKAANINSANMWNAEQNGSGAWLTWPPASGDILMANGFTVAVNADVNVGSSGELRNDTSYGATVSGYFNVTESCTITGNIAARTNCVYINIVGATVVINGNAGFASLVTTNNSAIWLNANSTLTVNGNSFGSNTTVAPLRSVYQTGGTLIFNGNATGGAATTSFGIEIGIGAVSTTIAGTITGGTLGDGLRHNGTSTVTIAGAAIGGAGSTVFGVNNASTGTINFTGTATGSTGPASAGINNASTGTVNHAGDALGGTGGQGVRNAAGGTITLTGNVIATTRQGATNNAGGTLTVSGYAQASSSVSAIDNAAQGILQVGETRSASNGLGAVTGAFRFASATAAKTMPYTPDGQISMTVLDVPAIVPAESDVRKTVAYGDGAYTGTLQLGRNRTSMAGRF